MKEKVKLHEITIESESKVRIFKMEVITTQKDIFKLCDSIERNHKEYPVITRPHFGEFKE